MSTLLPLRGRTAVITGAASGIGAATSVELARRGANLALADLNAAGLAATEAACRALGAEVSSHWLDVADREAVADFPKAVRAAHGGPPAVVINNAGVALGGLFETTSEGDFDWLMSINFEGVVRMTRAFLPHLRESAPAQLVNVSSLFGLIAPAGQTAYSAAKFAVRGFSNALRFELKGSDVGVTVVHPGGVATSIAKSARMSQSMTPQEIAAGQARAGAALRLPPERAARIIVDGLERRKPRVLVGGDAKFLALVERAFPVDYAGVLDRLGMSRPTARPPGQASSADPKR